MDRVGVLGALGGEKHRLFFELVTGNWRLTTAMRKRALSLRCPTCKKLVLRSDREFPFCSARCRLIDLGKWASNGYVVSTPIFDPDENDKPEPPKK